jgi:hypothetical protein
MRHPGGAFEPGPIFDLKLLGSNPKCGSRRNLEPKLVSEPWLRTARVEVIAGYYFASTSFGPRAPVFFRKSGQAAIPEPMELICPYGKKSGR